MAEKLDYREIVTHEELLMSEAIQSYGANKPSEEEGHYHEERTSGRNNTD